MTSHVHELRTTSISTPSDTEIRIERTFDAPRELVWEVYTDPDLMPEWLGPRERTMSIETMDIRPGGSYRYISRGPAGDEYIFFGEYREVVPPRLLVSTFQFEGQQCANSIDRVEFAEVEGGRTRIVATASFASKEERDTKLRSGMERGVTEGHGRLDEVLARRVGAAAG